MKMLFAAAALVIAGPALAQAAPATDHAAHAGHAAMDHSTHAKVDSALSLDTPIATLVANDKAKAVLDANLPGLTSHEHFEMFKGMSLSQLAPMAGDKMPAEALARVKAGLAAIR